MELSAGLFPKESVCFLESIKIFFFTPENEFVFAEGVQFPTIKNLPTFAVSIGRFFYIKREKPTCYKKIPAITQGIFISKCLK